jgi:hypothetical protein
MLLKTHHDASSLDIQKEALDGMLQVFLNSSADELMWVQLATTGRFAHLGMNASSLNELNYWPGNSWN